MLGSKGAYQSRDVQRMTPEKREWTLQRLVDLAKERKKKGNRGGPAAPTYQGKPLT